MVLACQRRLVVRPSVLVVERQHVRALEPVLGQRRELAPVLYCNAEKK